MRGYTRTIEKSMITSRSLVFNNHDNNKDSVPKKSNIPVSNVWMSKSSLSNGCPRALCSETMNPRRREVGQPTRLWRRLGVQGLRMRCGMFLCSLLFNYRKHPKTQCLFQVVSCCFHGLVDALSESFSTSWVLRLRLGCWKMGTAPGARRISWCLAALLSFPLA